MRACLLNKSGLKEMHCVLSAPTKPNINEPRNWGGLVRVGVERVQFSPENATLSTGEGGGQ